jgi:replicative superfamily II helicase
MARDIISVAWYRQMKGRAGRKGKDTCGESYLCYSKSDEEYVLRMVKDEMPTIESRLGSETWGFERALLEAVSANLATSQTAIETYATFTLYRPNKETLERAESFLLENGLLERVDGGYTQAGGALKANFLGKAIVMSALSIDEGLFVHRELQRSMRSFILDDELHLIYHCTPVYAQCEVDWKILRAKFDGLPESSIVVATAIGVQPVLINRAAQGAQVTDNEKLRIHKRFWIALMLQELVKEEPLSKVAESFGMERGFLQNLCSTATGFASMVQTFCQRLGWGNLALLLGNFKERLLFGVRADLLELVKLPYVKGYTARIFWEGGLRTVSTVAESDISDILPLLVKVWH